MRPANGLEQALQVSICLLSHTQGSENSDVQGKNSPDIDNRKYLIHMFADFGVSPSKRSPITYTAAFLNTFGFFITAWLITQHQPLAFFSDMLYNLIEKSFKKRGRKHLLNRLKRVTTKKRR